MLGLDGGDGGSEKPMRNAACVAAAIFGGGLEERRRNVSAFQVLYGKSLEY